MDGLRRILQTIEATGTEGERSADDDDELIAHLAGLKAGDGEFVAKDSRAHISESRWGHPALPATAPSMQDKTLRIDVEVLNRMMNLVGELVLTRNRILRCSPGAEDFPELARRLDSVTAELRESVMQARMQPVGHLFSKFPRMVRDLAIDAAGGRSGLSLRGRRRGWTRACWRRSGTR